MESFGATIVLVAAKTATLICGGALTYLSLKAYRRTGSPAQRALAVGIGLLLVGATIGGLLHQVAGLGLDASVSVQSVFTAVGFVVMTYSLFTAGTRTDNRTRSGSRTGD